MFISIVIPTYNRVQDLKRLVQQLFNQKTENWFKYELVVVDNNSSDSTLEYLQQISKTDSRIRSFAETKQGTGHALNKGIQQARGEIILFSADDLVVENDRLIKIAEVFRNHPDVECATGKVLPLWNNEKRPDWYSDQLKGVLVHVDYGEKKRVVDYCVGANSCFRKSVFDRFGLFNTNWRFEDVHFARRIRNNVKITYFPQVVVYHPVHPERLNKNYFKRWYALAGAFEGHDARIDGRNLWKVELWRHSEAVGHLIAFLGNLLNKQKRFYHQCQLIFFIALLKERNGKFKV